MPACPSHPSARARPRPFALVGHGNQQYTFHSQRRRSSAAVPAGDRAASEGSADANFHPRSEEHTSELQSPCNLVCRLLLEKKNKKIHQTMNKTFYTLKTFY